MVGSNSNNFKLNKNEFVPEVETFILFDCLLEALI